jgi:TP901 family phage tail tape measure protein
MSDAVSNIALGVSSQDALTHLKELREAFASLKTEMNEFSAARTSTDALSQGAAASASAIERLSADLNRAQSEMRGLRTLVDELTRANQGLQTALSGAARAQQEASTGATQAVTRANAEQTRSLTASLEQQVRATQDAANRRVSTEEETSRRIAASYRQNLGNSFSISYRLSPEEATASAMGPSRQEMDAAMQRQNLVAMRNEWAAAEEERRRQGRSTSQEMLRAELDRQAQARQTGQEMQRAEVERQAEAKQTGWLMVKAELDRRSEANRTYQDMLRAETERQAQAKVTAQEMQRAEAERAAEGRATAQEMLRADLERRAQGMATAQDMLRADLERAAEGRATAQDMQRAELERQAQAKATAQEMLMAEVQRREQNSLALKDARALIATQERQLQLAKEAMAYRLSGVSDDMVKAQYGTLVEGMANPAGIRSMEQQLAAAKTQAEQLAAALRDAGKNTAFLADAAHSDVQRLQRQLDLLKTAYTFSQQPGVTPQHVEEKYGSMAAARANPADIAGHEALLAAATAAAAQQNTLAGATGRVSAANREASLAMKEYGDAMKEVHSLTRGLAGGLQMLWVTWGSMAPLVAGAALTGTLRAVYNVGKEVEYQLQFVKALGEEPVDFDRFIKISEGSIVGLKDAANGMRALSQAGLDAHQALLALPTVMNLAVVGEMSVGQAALAATGVMNAFNLAIGDIDRVGDIFAKVAATTNTSVAGMTEAMKQASTVGDMFKVSIEETAASIGVLAKRNIEGTAAGTSLTNALKGLYEPSDKAKEALQRLGIETRDPNGQLKNYTELLKDLALKLSTLNESGKQNFLGTITDQRGAKTISAITSDMGAYMKALDDAKHATGFMTQAVSVLEDTTTGSLKRMSNAFEGSFAKAFESAAPAIRQVVDALAEGARSQQFIDLIDNLARGASQLTLLMVEHGKTILWVLGIYAGARVISGFTSGLEVLKLRSIEAAAAQQAMAAGQTTLTASAALAATGIGRLAAVLRGLTAAAGWIGLAIAALTTLYELWTGGADKAELAEQKVQNSINTTLTFLDREIDRLKQRNELLQTSLRDEFGIGGDAQQKTIQSEQERQQQHLKDLQGQKASLQSEIDKLSSKTVDAKVGQTVDIRDINALREKRAEMQSLNRTIEDTRAKLAGVSDKLQEISAQDSEGRNLNQQLKLMRDLVALEHQMGGGGVQYERNGNAATHGMLPQVEALKQRTREATGAADLQQIQQEYDNAYRHVQGVLQNFEKLDKKAISDEMQARIKEIEGARQRLDDSLKKQEEQAKARNKAGEMGDAELLAKQRELSVTKATGHAQAAADMYSVYSEYPDHKKDMQAQVEALKLAKQQGAEASEKYDAEMAAMTRKFDDETLAHKAETLRMQGHLVDAYLLEMQAKYGKTIDKIERDLNNPELKLTSQQRKSLEDRRASIQEEIAHGVLKNSFTETVDSFSSKKTDMQNSIDDLAPKAAKGDAFSLLAVAQEAENIRRQSVPALQALAEQARATAKELGDPKLLAQANQMSRELAKEADKTIELWQQAGKAIEKSLTEAFGAGGKAAGGMISAYISYTKEKENIDARVQKVKDDPNLDDAERQKKLDELSKASAQAQINNYATMVGAAKGFFDTKSKGYAVLQKAEQAFRLFEIGLALESYVKKTFFATAETTAAVAGDQAKAASAVAVTPTLVGASMAQGQAAAVAGVANQAQGDPYSAWVRMALMAATMAALGFAVMGSGSSDAPARDPAKDLQDRNGTQAQGRSGDNTAIGYYDWELQKSDSIDKSLEIVKNNSNIALRYTQLMTAHLQSIKDNIGNLAVLVSNAAGVRGTMADTAGLGLGSVNGGMGFSITRTSLQDSGIVFGQQTLADAIAQGMKANSYMQVQTDTSSWWGLSHDIENVTKYGSLSDDLLRSFTSTLSEVAQTAQVAGQSLGRFGGNLQDALQNIDLASLGLTQASFKGMSQKEVQDAIDAMMSQAGDRIAHDLVPGLDAFQRAGESYLTTLVRVSTGLEQAKNALQEFGLQATSLENIQNKTASDIGAESVREAITNKESTPQFNPRWDGGGTWTQKLNGVGDIIEHMTGSVDDLVNAYRDLLKIRSEMFSMGLNYAGLTQKMVDGAGSLQNLTSGMDAYTSKFFSAADQQRMKIDMLTAQFKNLGVEMPTSEKGFVALVNSIDLTTDSGQKLYGQLMSLAGAFADAADASGTVIAQLAELRHAITSTDYKTDPTTMTDWAKRWLDVKNNAADLFDTIDKAIFDQKQSAYNAYDSMTSLTADQATAKAQLLADMQQMQAEQEARSQQKISDLWGQFNTAGITPEQQLDLAGKLKDAILNRYQIEQQNSQKLIAAAKQIKDYLDSLLTGDLSPLTNSGKLQAAQSDYQSTLAAAQGGDTNALSALQGKAQTYLEQARNFYASSDAYKAIFDQVYSSLQAMGQSADAQGNSAIDIANQQLTQLQSLETAVQGVQDQASKQYDTAVNTLAAAIAQQQALEATYGVVSTIPQLLADMPAGLTAALLAAGVVNKNPIGTAPTVATSSQLPSNPATIQPAPTYGAGTPNTTVPRFFDVAFGSHAKGLDYVPFDGYMAQLHKGERVLTAAATARMDAGHANLIDQLTALRAEVAALRSEQRDHTGAVIRSHYDATDRAADKVVAGTKDAAETAAWQQRSAATLK